MPRSRTLAAADFLVAVAEEHSHNHLRRLLSRGARGTSYREDFGAFEERIKKVILATISTTDILRRQQVESLPFGGLHLLIYGDFYQLRCVSGVPLYNKSHALTSDNSKVKKTLSSMDSNY